MPTADYFPVAGTPWGPMGSLICWESYMPLARVALYEKGVTLYISPNTNDNEEWQATIRHIAIEGHCYFINCDMFFTKDVLSGRPSLPGGDRQASRYRLPRRQQYHRPLRPLRYRNHLGSGGHLVR